MQTHAVNRESGEVSIFAEVSQGLFPVLDATLYAQLIHPELNETSVDTVKLGFLLNFNSTWRSIFQVLNLAVFKFYHKMFNEFSNP